MNNSDNKREIIERIKNQFSSAYLTLISLIEASILGFLIYDFNNKLIPISSFTLDSIVIFCEYTTVFLIIVIVWGEYVMGSIVFRWIPGITDVFIPFLTGLAQASAICFIDYELSSHWLFALSSICVFSWWAYINMYQKSEKNKEDNKPVLTALNTWKKINYTITSTLAGFLIMVGIFISIYSSRWLNITISCLTCIITILYVFKCRYYWQTINKTLES